MRNDLHANLTVRIFTDRKCFGPGVAELLRRVRELHSLRAAAMSMNMAYSKAWRIIRTAETVFGCKLLSSTIGGAHGGGAVLTESLAEYTGADRYAKDAMETVRYADSL